MVGASERGPQVLLISRLPRMSLPSRATGSAAVRYMMNDYFNMLSIIEYVNTLKELPQLTL